MKRGAVGGRVRELRDQLQWSQGDLCARLKECGYPVPQPNLSLMEQGKRKIDADAVLCFAEVLGVDPNYLYGIRTTVEAQPAVIEERPRGGMLPTISEQFRERFTRLTPKQAELLLGMLDVLQGAGVE